MLSRNFWLAFPEITKNAFAAARDDVKRTILFPVDV